MKIFMVFLFSLNAIHAFAENQITITSRRCIETAQSYGDQRDAILRAVASNDSLNNNLERQMQQLAQVQSLIQGSLTPECEQSLGTVALRLLIEVPANESSFSKRLACIRNLVENREKGLTADQQKAQLGDEAYSTIYQSLMRERRINRSYCAEGIQSPELINLLFQQY